MCLRMHKLWSTINLNSFKISKLCWFGSDQPTMFGFLIKLGVWCIFFYDVVVISCLIHKYFNERSFIWLYRLIPFPNILFTHSEFDIRLYYICLLFYYTLSYTYVNFVCMIHVNRLWRKREFKRQQDRFEIYLRRNLNFIWTYKPQP